MSESVRDQCCGNTSLIVRVSTACLKFPQLSRSSVTPRNMEKNVIFLFNLLSR